MTLLRQKMIEDMQLRDFSEKTGEAYVATVKGLAIGGREHQLVRIRFF